MKELFLTLMLAVVSSSAMAEWVEVVGDKQDTAYADPTTIRKNGSKVKMWVMWDYLTAQEGETKPFMSVRIQYEFDCKEELIRQIVLTTFSGNMLGGNMIDTEGSGFSEPVPPRTFGKALWEFACGASQIPIAIAPSSEEKPKQQSAVKHDLTDEYMAKILAKIKSNIRMPTELPGNPIAEFDVTLLPGGEILDVRLRTSSGFTAFDRAVERAIVVSRPLPVPPNPLLFPNFRNLSLKVHYLE